MGGAERSGPRPHSIFHLHELVLPAWVQRLLARLNNKRQQLQGFLTEAERLATLLRLAVAPSAPAAEPPSAPEPAATSSTATDRS